METPYRALTFNRGDTLTDDTMEQLIANYQYVHDNTPRARYYRDPGRPRTDILNIIVAGRKRVPQAKKKDQAKVVVNLRKAFDPACQPHVTYGIVSDMPKNVFCVINGPDGKLYPNSQGFEIRVEMEETGNKASIPKDFYVDWHAFGFRKSDMNDF